MELQAAARANRLGKTQGGKEAENAKFLMLLYCSGKALHPNPAALGPWQLHRQEQQARKRAT